MDMENVGRAKTNGVQLLGIAVPAPATTASAVLVVSEQWTTTSTSY